jgi:enoyl-CoA hydratase
MIDITQHGTITLLTMNHGKANAQDVEFCREVKRCFEELRHSQTRAVVLTGQGKIFSAGVDLLRLTAEGPDYVQEFLPALSQMFGAVFFFPKPVVSAINGHAIAGGCVLACCADYRVMAQGSGRIGVPELLVGVPFPAVALEVMRLACAPQYLEDLVYNGPTIGAEEALQRGLVNALTEPAQLLNQALKVASNLAALPPKAFALTKTQLHATVAAFLRESGPGIDVEVIKQWASPETLEIVRTYIARTIKKTQS